MKVYIQPPPRRSDPNSLTHHKYVAREFVNGKYRYVYKTPKGKTNNTTDRAEVRDIKRRTTTDKIQQEQKAKDAADDQAFINEAIGLVLETHGFKTIDDASAFVSDAVSAYETSQEDPSQYSDAQLKLINSDYSRAEKIYKDMSDVYNLAVGRSAARDAERSMNKLNAQRKKKYGW